MSVERMRAEIHLAASVAGTSNHSAYYDDKLL